jgi:hypothetical protein
MQTNIEPVIRRVQNYEYVDGLSEIVFGGAACIMGLFGWAVTQVPAGTWLNNAMPFLMAAAVAVYAWVGQRLVQAVRARLTYRRTGYAAPRRATGKRRWLGLGLLAVGSAAVSVAVVILLVRLRWLHLWFPLLEGAGFGLLLLFLGYFRGLARYYTLAGLSFLLGLAAAWADLGEFRGAALYLILLGLAYMVTGALILWSYLRQNPRPLDDPL